MQEQSHIARFFSATKLYWGLAALFVIGIIISPESLKGNNIFLSQENLSNVLRQVSNNGVLAVGMTLVILTAGIDLSVGTMMAMGSTLAAMLITQRGWNSASLFCVPATGLIVFVLMASAAFSALGSRVNMMTKIFVSLVVGAAFGGAASWWGASQVPSGFTVIGVLVAVPLATLLLGSFTGFIIAKGKLQPFIVTLAMMITVLGGARLIAGEGHSVYPIYYGENAPESFSVLGEMLWGFVPVPGLFFLASVAFFWVVLNWTRFGRYIYALGGSEETTYLSGINVDRVKIAVYAICGFLAGLTGVLFAAQFEQGKPDAGTGNELDAIAAVVIGGTSLMGGRGSVIGTLVGVLIFGILSNILVLQEIPTNWQLVFKGGIIILAVLLQEGRFRAEFNTLRRNIAAAFKKT